MSALEMGFRDAEFLISEANGYRSREEATVVGGANGLPAGQVLEIDTGNYVAYNGGTVAGILWGGRTGTGPATVVVRDAEVNWNHLTVTGTKATVIAGLNALGIAVRED